METAVASAPGSTTSIGTRTTLLIFVALAVTLLAPTWLLLIGPIILGVPHVTNDLRLLIVRPRKQVGWLTLVLVLVPIVVMAAIRTTTWASGVPAHAELEAWLGCAAVAGAVVVAPGAWSRRLVVLLVAVGLALGLTRYPRDILVAFSHLHNLVAFAILCVWARARAQRLPTLAIAAYLVAAGAILVGLPAFSTAPALGFDLPGVARSVASNLDPQWGQRIVLSYAFAQMVHYLVWIDLAPRALGGPSARKELGNPAWIMMIAATIGLCVWGLVSPHGARNGYLALVIWHGWLELAMLGHLWVRHSGLGSVVRDAPAVASASPLRAAA
jgi:uncharacterized membrane protein